jgi:alpha-beta hydrolase superfamily lysophospholipase
MMYGVLQGILQVWTPENEQRMPKDLAILITCGTRDPVGSMTASERALIERYRQYGVKDLSHIFYEGARHELLNDFCREQMYADVVSWLDGHLEGKMSEEIVIVQ